jgi:hypothetical protein
MDNIDFDNLRKELEVRHRFPRTTSLHKWRDYLGRELSPEERVIIEEYKIESHMNDLMKGLYERCIMKNLCVPLLSLLHGNCLFESLNYHKIGNTVKELRNGLSMLMFMFRDVKNFFPNQSESMKELYDITNEIDIVLYRNNDNVVDFCNYSYDAMCQDLTNHYSWTRLPTELILMIISLIYKIQIIIIVNSSEYEHTINVYNDASLPCVFLGKLNESHYVPVDVIKDSNYQPLYYLDAKKTLLNWGGMIEEHMINEHIEFIKKKYTIEKIKHYETMNKNNLPEISTAFNSIDQNIVQNTVYEANGEFADVQF